MRTHTATHRLTAAFTTAALLLGSTAISGPAHAQPAPQPFPAQPDQNAVDPPARVGRLVTTSGAVSYHAAGDTQWTPATMNFPVASGSAFWTEPNAQAELELSASRVALAGGTEVDIGSLDANGFQATLTQGEVLLRPRDLAPGETWTLVTPRGSVTTTHTGRIAVVAGDTASPTIVSVLEGDATLAGPGLEQTLTAGQAATITGTDTLQATIGPAQPDAFVRSGLARERPRLPPPASAHPEPPPPGIANLPGGDDLQGYGVWNNNREYGQVWYPSVEPGWVPYRQGHWAFILPWGWTWVDDARWGFAPFHYGRWVELNGRWGWTPEFERERHERYPVYAPALVTFLGIGVGVAIGAAFAPRDIGWVPLGPREPYRPWFRASPQYVVSVNSTRVVNITTINNFRNQRAATMVPASALTSSRPIRAIAQPIGPQMLANARPLTGTHPVLPVATTAGITPVTAQQLHLAPTGPGFVRAPGPAIVPTTAGTHVPVLRPPAPTGPVVGPVGGPPIVPRLNGPASQIAPGTAPPLTAPPRPAQPFAAPPVVQPHVGPQLAAPPVVQPRSTPQIGVPPVVQPRPGPQFNAPPVGQPHTGPQFTAPTAVPQTARPPAPPMVQHPTQQFTAPAPVQRPPPAAPPPTPHFQAPPPPAAVPHFQAPPAPPVHLAPPPPPVVQAPAPPPPPHPAPPAPPARPKKPGEP